SECRGDRRRLGTRLCAVSLEHGVARRSEAEHASEAVTDRELDLVRISSLLQHAEVLVHRVDVLPRRLVEPDDVEQWKSLYDGVLIRDSNWEIIFRAPVVVHEVGDVENVEPDLSVLSADRVDGLGQPRVDTLDPWREGPVARRDAPEIRTKVVSR